MSRSERVNRPIDCERAIIRSCLIASSSVTSAAPSLVGGDHGTHSILAVLPRRARG